MNKYTILTMLDSKRNLISIWLNTFKNNKFLEKTLITTIKKQDSEKVVRKLRELIGDRWCSEEEDEFGKGREKSSCSWEIDNMLDGFWYEEEEK